ncbi:MAG: DinB family protein [Pseudobdellovibrionaceae bacterium]|jgi:hypothetical protein
MKTQSTESQKQSPPPKLQAPGAGLPWLESLLLKYWVKPRLSGQATWEISSQRFDKVHQKIADEIQGLSAEQLATPVLIERVRGLEDSSRYWSIGQTLEHIVIVGSMIYGLLPQLAQGQVPDVVADTSKVKPSQDVDSTQAVKKFEEYRSSQFKALSKKQGFEQSAVRFVHPWFGPMSDREWFWLLGVHAGIHLEQIRRIKKGLKTN